MFPMMLAEVSAGAGTFDASAALDLGKTVLTWILDVIKGESVMACAFVLAVLVPAGFGIVNRVKNTAR